MECAYCGAENSDGSYFCIKCGAALGSTMAAEAVSLHRYPHIWTTDARQPVDAPMQLTHVPQTENGLCIAAMVLGIFSLSAFLVPFVPLILGIPAIIYGGKGMRGIRRSPVTEAGYSMGLAGLISGIIGTVLGVAAIILYIFVLIGTSYPNFH